MQNVIETSHLSTRTNDAKAQALLFSFYSSVILIMLLSKFAIGKNYFKSVSELWTLLCLAGQVGESVFTDSQLDFLRRLVRRTATKANYCFYSYTSSWVI